MGLTAWPEPGPVRKWWRRLRGRCPYCARALEPYPVLVDGHLSLTRVEMCPNMHVGRVIPAGDDDNLPTYVDNVAIARACAAARAVRVDGAVALQVHRPADLEGDMSPGDYERPIELGAA